MNKSEYYESFPKDNCRGCGKILVLYRDHSAKCPKTEKWAKWGWYGGWCCSESCEVKSCLELERTMPGHTAAQKTLGGHIMSDIKRRWINE